VRIIVNLYTDVKRTRFEH